MGRQGLVIFPLCFIMNEIVHDGHFIEMPIVSEVERYALALHMHCVTAGILRCNESVTFMMRHFLE